MMESQYTTSYEMFMDMETLDEKTLMKVHKAFYKYIVDEDGDDYLVDRYVDDYERLEICLDDDRSMYLEIATNSFKSLVSFIDAFMPGKFFELSAVVKKAIKKK